MSIYDKKPLQYCKVISLQLIKISEKKVVDFELLLACTSVLNYLSDQPRNRGTQVKSRLFQSLLFFIFFFGYAGSSLLRGLFPSCSKWGLPSTSPVAEHSLWCARASVVAAPSSIQRTGSLLVARGLQFSGAAGPSQTKDQT